MNLKPTLASSLFIPLGCLLLAALGLLWMPASHATAAFARQTGEPCSACHMQAYGPWLTHFGRKFKMNGFVAGHANKLPDLLNAFSTQAVASYTHTQADQPGGAAPGLSNNNNTVNDWNALYYTGRVWDKVGAYLQLNFNPQVAKNISLAMGEIRFADHTEAFGRNLIYGVSANNGPTMSDVWMTTPEWMYPYNSSQLAPTPTAQTLMMSLMGFTAGSSAYVNWDDKVHLELGAYTSMAKNMATGLGVYSPTNPLIDGGAPFWRLWFQHIEGPHSVMLGGYGMQANIYPQGVKTFGTNSVTDWNFDANYQYMMGDHMFMLMGRYTRDNWDFNALTNAQDAAFAKSAALARGRGEQMSGTQFSNFATNPNQYLTNLMVMGMYNFHQTYNLTFSYNHTSGSSDTALYAPAPISGSRNGSPNSEYFQVELDYVPFGKGESQFDNINLRLSLQYTAYTKFNGASSNYDGSGRSAADNNTLYFVGDFMLW